MNKILITLVLMSRFLYAEESHNTLVIWHALDGELGKVFNELLKDFEKQEPTIKVQAISKGNYDKTLDAFLKDPQEPDVVQVFEMGTAVMQSAKKFTPIKTVFSWIKKPIPNFTSAASSFYKGQAKTLQCLPFSAATVILFYNKTLLDRIDENPPETFEDFEKMAIKHRKNGTLLTLAAGWLSGHHMDQIGAIHNIPIATKGNGVDGQNAKLVDNPFFNTHWIFLQTWYRAGLFSLKAGPEAEKAFADGEIALISQGSNRLGILEKAVDGRFEIGVAHFPYWKSIGKPGKTIAGGSAFWVAKKKYSPAKKIALGKLLAFLSDAKTQGQWQEQTGYIPIVAVPANERISKAAKLAEEALTRGEPMTYNRGIMLPNFPKIRELIVAEMIAMIKGDKPDAKEALATIVEKGNELLKQ